MKNFSRDEIKKISYTIFFTNKTIVIAIIIGIALSIASPYFLTPENLFNVSRQIVVNAIVALGFTILLGMGEIDLSVGGMLALVGVIVGKLMVDLDVPVFIAIICAMISGVLLGIMKCDTNFSLLPTSIYCNTGNSIII